MGTLDDALPPPARACWTASSRPDGAGEQFTEAREPADSELLAALLAQVRTGTRLRAAA